VNELDRRGFIGALALAAGGVASAASTNRNTDAVDRLDLGDPRAATDAFVRMRCNVAGRWGVWLYRGEFIVKPEGSAARKLCRIEGMSFNRATPLADGGYAYDLEECGYWCDLVTGAPLDTLVNPFTEQVVRPAHYRSKLAMTFVDRVVSPRSAELPPGLEFRGEISSPTMLGSTLFMAEDLFVRTPAQLATESKPARPVRTQTSMAMFAAQLADLLQPSESFVPADMVYNTMNSFVGWLNMSEVAGVQNMRLVARKFADDRTAPQWLRQRLMRDHPDFLSSRDRRAQ
jgi:hypothetical protein